MVVTLSSTADCMTYNIYWSYTFASGTTPYTDLDIASYGTSTWNTQIVDLASRNPWTHPVSYANLKTWGHPLGVDVTFRLRFRNSAWLYSPYYTGTITNMLKQAPTAPVSISFS